ncbi:hypothetical protein SPFM14_00215 [Salmonella phage SPFM14]|nr:hypothetical protein SPFM14_00215 [Salmonella phage SPFM14]
MVGYNRCGQVRLESKLHRFNDTIMKRIRYGYFKKPTATMADCVQSLFPIEGLRQFNVLASKLFPVAKEHLADWLNYLENPTLIYREVGGALDVHDPHDGIKVYGWIMLLNMKPIYLHPSEAAEYLATYASQEHGLFLPEDPKKRQALFMLFKAWVFFRVPEYATITTGLRDFEIREVVMSEKKRSAAAFSRIGTGFTEG